MKTKAQKSQIIKDLSAKLPKAAILIFTSFSQASGKGLSVSQMRNLKISIRETGGEYLVVKKNLAGIAAQQTGISKMVSVENLDGSVGLVLGSGQGDSIALSKSVYDFSKANPSLRILGAVMEQRYLDADRFAEFAKLSSKDALMARLFGMLQYPIKNFLVLLNNIKN